MGAEKIRELQHIEVQPQNKFDYKGYGIGILLTFSLAILAGLIAKLPLFSIMGIMIISILLGALWNNTLPLPTSINVSLGIQFSSKKLLRAGIILLGFRLNLFQIVDSGVSVILIDILVIAFTIMFILTLGRIFKTNKELTILVAAGTAICGAAAIVAVAPLIKSKQEQTAVAVSCIAVLGTIGALLFIFLYPYLPLTNTEYGLLVGATLHELAHVVAASVPGGELGSETAILVKLGRVLLLIPVALLISFFINRKNEKHERNLKKLPIPWFIFGFLLMSFINTLQLIPDHIINILLLLSIYFLAMGMAGLGLSIKWSDFRKVGFKPIVVAILGFVGLLCLSPILLFLYRLF
ncbi:putative integral membrane protein (TIGR00698 family) [Neobacillus niacini]|uniref:YeiH family protein n=1 Tax=Neobacillus niacini TaxID=86668 RepID=UPI00277DD213|nr:YeiH family protein [Neobacillus niacini]MDQ1003405.1 putative integral membrane protein (TIGR00698 family) [Neobacillus niacini]